MKKMRSILPHVSSVVLPLFVNLVLAAGCGVTPAQETQEREEHPEDAILAPAYMVETQIEGQTYHQQIPGDVLSSALDQFKERNQLDVRAIFQTGGTVMSDAGAITLSRTAGGLRSSRTDLGIDLVATLLDAGQGFTVTAQMPKIGRTLTFQTLVTPASSEVSAYLALQTLMFSVSTMLPNAPKGAVTQPSQPDCPQCVVVVIELGSIAQFIAWLAAIAVAACIAYTVTCTALTWVAASKACPDGVDYVIPAAVCGTATEIKIRDWVVNYKVDLSCKAEAHCKAKPGT